MSTTPVFSDQKYMVISCGDLYELNEEVNGWIKEGWLPNPGLVRFDGEWHQAMVHKSVMGTIGIESFTEVKKFNKENPDERN